MMRIMYRKLQETMQTRSVYIYIYVCRVNRSRIPRKQIAARAKPVRTVKFEDTHQHLTTHRECMIITSIYYNVPPKVTRLIIIY